MTVDKPFSQASENNKHAILDKLKPLFTTTQNVLEVGSGTGQHAVFFAQAMPSLHWHTSDLRGNHAGICQWIAEAGLDNVSEPFAFDVSADNWPQTPYDAVFTANTLHIMAWESGQLMLRHIGKLINNTGYLLIYGPFNYHNNYTSDSNARFDQWLQQQSPHSAIRDFEAVNAEVRATGLTLHSDQAMPANNRLLCWQKN